MVHQITVFYKLLILWIASFFIFTKCFSHEYDEIDNSDDDVFPIELGVYAILLTSYFSYLMYALFCITSNQSIFIAQHVKVMMFGIIYSHTAAVALLHIHPVNSVWTFYMTCIFFTQFHRSLSETMTLPRRFLCSKTFLCSTIMFCNIIIVYLLQSLFGNLCPSHDYSRHQNTWSYYVLLQNHADFFLKTKHVSLFFFFMPDSVFYVSKLLFSLCTVWLF